LDGTCCELASAIAKFLQQADEEESWPSKVANRHTSPAIGRIRWMDARQHGARPRPQQKLVVGTVLAVRRICVYMHTRTTTAVLPRHSH
jgi:hypothetical protein